MLGVHILLGLKPSTGRCSWLLQNTNLNALIHSTLHAMCCGLLHLYSYTLYSYMPIFLHTIQLYAYIPTHYTAVRLYSYTLYICMPIFLHIIQLYAYIPTHYTAVCLYSYTLYSYTPIFLHIIQLYAYIYIIFLPSWHLKHTAVQVKTAELC